MTSQGARDIKKGRLSRGGEQTTCLRRGPCRVPATRGAPIGCHSFRGVSAFGLTHNIWIQQGSVLMKLLLQLRFFAPFLSEPVKSRSGHPAADRGPQERMDSEGDEIANAQCNAQQYGGGLGRIVAPNHCYRGSRRRVDNRRRSRGTAP